MEKAIVLNDLKNPSELFRLRDYIRELYEFIDKRLVFVASSATPIFDCDLGESFLITLTANVTGITIKNAYKGKAISLIFLQGGVGGYSIAGWAANVKLVGGAYGGGDAVGEYATLTLIYDNTNWVELCRTNDVK